MQRSLLVLAVLLSAVFVQPQPSGAITLFFDDFNDGNADGWMFASRDGRVNDPASSWRVEDGRLLEFSGYDAQMAFVENLSLSSQSIEVQADILYFAGIALWYEDLDNYVFIGKYRGGGAIYVGEIINGIGGYGAAYPYLGTQYGLYDFRLDADSSIGQLDFYVDGQYQFTYTATTKLRYGLSGLGGGNGGGYFDNFMVTSVPEPSNLLLITAGLTGLAFARRRFRN